MHKCYSSSVPFRVDNIPARSRNWDLCLKSYGRTLLLCLVLCLPLFLVACASGPTIGSVPTGEPVQSGGITTQTVPAGEPTVISGEKSPKTGETQQQVAKGESTVPKENKTSTETKNSVSSNATQQRTSDQAMLIALTGHVTDAEGNPLPGVTIETQPLEPELSRQTAFSDASGLFKLSLAPGKYKITFLHSGFSEVVREITLQPGRAMSLEIALSVVPIGERQPGPYQTPEDKQVGAFSVLELTFANDIDLHRWLNEQASQQKIALSIIPMKNQTSLFVIREEKAISYTVMPVNVALCKEKLQEYINLNKDKLFVGVHLLGNKFLIIFGNEK